MTRLLEINKKYQVVFLCILIFIIVGGFYLLFFKNEEKENKDVIPTAIVLNNGDLAINYLEGNKIEINSFTKNVEKYTISITNTGGDSLYYSISLNNCVVNNESVKVILENEKGKILYSNNIKDGNTTLYSLKSIESGVTERYYLSFNSENEIQNVRAIIEVENESMNEQSFADLLLKKNNINEAKSIPGVNLAVEDEGLIKSEDEFGTTYYFRGAVNNNYLKIGEHLFRVVRINGNGTVRVVLDEPVDALYSFNNSTTLVNDSVILEKSILINNLTVWYEKELGRYSNYLTSGNYCSDNNFINVGTGINYSNDYQRIFVNNEPTYKCNSYVMVAKIGLLSADEITFAGAYRDNENKKYYLYNSNINYNVWTSSSYGIMGNETFMITLNANGEFGSVKTTDALKIRPVVNLSVNANVKGEGTLKNPYILIVN